MDWQTLLTAYAGALGGTATALALVGVFGKTLLEHWFNKDFKRYESKLDSIASKEGKKFEYLFPQQADAARELLALSKKAGKSYADAASANHPEDIVVGYKKHIKDLRVIYDFIEAKSVLLPDELITTVKTCIESLMNTHLEARPGYLGTAVSEKLDPIERACKLLIGN